MPFPVNVYDIGRGPIGVPGFSGRLYPYIPSVHRNVSFPSSSRTFAGAAGGPAKIVAYSGKPNSLFAYDSVTKVVYVFVWTSDIVNVVDVCENVEITPVVVTVLKFTLNEDPISKILLRYGFVKYAFPSDTLMSVTRKEYHTPVLSVISATKLHKPTPADNVRKSCGLRADVEIENPG
jgi:hypothetical protein